jgi:hypothetical protein
VSPSLIAQMLCPAITGGRAGKVLTKQRCSLFEPCLPPPYNVLHVARDRASTRKTSALVPLQTSAFVPLPRVFRKS